MKKNVKKSFFDLDKDWIDQVRVNLSAVERRTASLTKRRTVKKEYQVAWLLKAITLLDLTTLSGDHTLGKVEKLCIKELNPISDLILKQLKTIIHQENLIINDEELNYIISYSKGDLRKAINYLQANKTNKKLNLNIK